MLKKVYVVITLGLSSYYYFTKSSEFIDYAMFNILLISLESYLDQKDK